MNFIPLALYTLALLAYSWHFAQRQPFGTRDFDRIVDSRAKRSVRHGLGNVVGSDGLEASGRQANTFVVGATSGDRAEEFEELRCPDDRVRDA